MRRNIAIGRRIFTMNCAPFGAHLRKLIPIPNGMTNNRSEINIFKNGISTSSLSSNVGPNVNSHKGQAPVLPKKKKKKKKRGVIVERVFLAFVSTWGY